MKDLGQPCKRTWARCSNKRSSFKSTWPWCRPTRFFEQLIELEADKIALEEALYNTQRGYIQTRRGGLAPTSNLIEMMIVSQHPSPLSCSCLGELALTSQLAAFPVHVCRLFEGWPMTSLT